MTCVHCGLLGYAWVVDQRTAGPGVLDSVLGSHFHHFKYSGRRVSAAVLLSCLQVIRVWSELYATVVSKLFVHICWLGVSTGLNRLRGGSLDGMCLLSSSFATYAICAA